MPGREKGILAMGTAMTGMHVGDPSLLWAGGAVLAAVTTWAGIRHGGSLMAGMVIWG